MREGTPSRTAAWVAAARSLGSVLPPEARLADDPYGLKFADYLPQGRGRAGALAVKWIWPLRAWVMYMQVRTRVLDDILLSFVAGGGRQVVLLGAGYDCRALRFARALEGATVFEVDHPATQGHKRRVLAAAPASVRYVSWDFEARPMRELPSALAAAGHDAARPSLTIWEGVTMYLTPDAIDASVRAVRAYSGTGSQLAITYFTRDMLEKPSAIRTMMSVVVAQAGEPFRFGWHPGELPGWLAARGFALDRDLSIGEEARRLLPPKEARWVPDRGQRIALARTESIAVATAR
jgi:methyltransferase (TIGR00027 family)